MTETWWQVEARKHPGCWITVLIEDQRIVASPDPEVARAAVPPGTVPFIFWQDAPCDGIRVGV